MKKSIIIIWLLFFKTIFHGQTTLSWSGYTAGATGTTYTAGTIPNKMSAVVTTNNLTLADGSPKYSTSTSPYCYISAGGLVLHANHFNNYASSYFIVTITLNPGYNGSCSAASFSIRDINSNESTGSFLDIVEISAIDGNNSAVAVANIVTTLAASTSSVIVGNTRKIVGHNSTTESYVYSGGSPYSNLFSGACGSTNVVVTPPSGVPLKSITIKFRPANAGTAAFSCSTCAYVLNSSGGVWYPDYQYISISNITLSPTAGCTILPIELVSFTAKRIDNQVNLNWKTASEKNNDYFSVERSADGFNFEEIEKIKGAADSYKILSYDAIDENPLNEISYYRLKQVDFNGQMRYSDIVSVDADNSKATIGNIAPNPTASSVNFDFYTPVNGELNYEIMDLTGRVLISKSQLLENGYTKISVLMNDLPNGIYFLKATFDKTSLVSVNKIIKN
jgi:hypothetical protein